MSVFFDPLIIILTIYTKEIIKNGNMSYVCLAQHYLH